MRRPFRQRPWRRRPRHVADCRHGAPHAPGPSRPRSCARSGSRTRRRGWARAGPGRPRGSGRRRAARSTSAPTAGPFSTVSSTTSWSTTGALSARGASSRTASATASTSPRVTAMTEVPRSALSSAGVPSAMTRPWSTTTMSRHRRSASSRYWVVSSTVVPSRHQVLDDAPEVLAALGVEAGGGLVEEEDRRAGHQRSGQVEATAHAARVGLEDAVRRVGQAELLEQLVGPGPGDLAAQVAQAADHADVLAAGQVLVDGGVLAGQPDDAAHDVGLARHVVAEDGGRALVGFEDRGQDAHRRGLAGAVGTEQAEHGARLDLE